MKHAQVALTALLLGAWVSGCGDSTAPQGNNKPRIIALTAQPGSVILSGVVQVTVIASDSDSDMLTYSWSSSGGSFGDSTLASTTWTAPVIPGTYTLAILVSDEINTVSASASVDVGNASLTVSSDPPGALITLDGLGTAFRTPHTFAPIPTGAHAARLFSQHFAYTPVTHLTNLVHAQAETLQFGIALANTTPLDLGRSDILSVGGVAFLPAGNGIVFAAETNLGTGLYATSIFGSSADGTELLTGVRMEEPITVSADGTRVFYLSANDSLTTATITDTDGNGVVDMVGTPLPLENFRFGPAISADNRVAFSLTRSEDPATNQIFWSEFANNTLGELNFGSTTAGKLPTWKPDDSALAFVWDGSIYLSDAIFPGAIALVDSLFNTAPAWGPWGPQHVAYFHGVDAGSVTDLQLASEGSPYQATVYVGLSDPRFISWNPLVRELVVSHNPGSGAEILRIDGLPIP